MQNVKSSLDANWAFIHVVGGCKYELNLGKYEGLILIFVDLL